MLLYLHAAIVVRSSLLSISQVKYKITLKLCYIVKFRKIELKLLLGNEILRLTF